MRKLLLLLVASSMFTGCVVRARPAGRVVVRSGPRACPPHHHLQGGVCVHNGRWR